MAVRRMLTLILRISRGSIHRISPTRAGDEEQPVEAVDQGRPVEHLLQSHIAEDGPDEHHAESCDAAADLSDGVVQS